MRSRPRPRAPHTPAGSSRGHDPGPLRRREAATAHNSGALPGRSTCLAGNVTLRPFPVFRSQTANPISFSPSRGPCVKCSSASASLPGGVPLSLGTILMVIVSAPLTGRLAPPERARRVPPFAARRCVRESHWDGSSCRRDPIGRRILQTIAGPGSVTCGCGQSPSSSTCAMASASECVMLSSVDCTRIRCACAAAPPCNRSCGGPNVRNTSMSFQSTPRE